MGVGSTIKFLRMSAGLRQADLAERLGVSSNYISLVENDRRDPSLSFLRDLSDELGVPLGVLFLNTAADYDDLSDREKLLLTQIRDLVFEISHLKLQRQAENASDAQLS
jgi:transcriptional regulator with XRE-family HTH domain